MPKFDTMEEFCDFIEKLTEREIYPNDHITSIQPGPTLLAKAPRLRGWGERTLLNYIDRLSNYPDWIQNDPLPLLTILARKHAYAELIQFISGFTRSQIDYHTLFPNETPHRDDVLLNLLKKLLLQDVSFVKEAGGPLLFASVYLCYKKSVKFLLKHGVDPNFQDIDHFVSVSALACMVPSISDHDVGHASEKDKLCREILITLTTHGANLNLSDVFGRTPIYFCEGSSPFSVAQFKRSYFRELLDTCCPLLPASYEKISKETRARYREYFSPHILHRYLYETRRGYTDDFMAILECGAGLSTEVKALVSHLGLRKALSSVINIGDIQIQDAEILLIGYNRENQRVLVTTLQEFRHQWRTKQLKIKWDMINRNLLIAHPDYLHPQIKEYAKYCLTRQIFHTMLPLYQKGLPSELGNNVLEFLLDSFFTKPESHEMHMGSGLLAAECYFQGLATPNQLQRRAYNCLRAQILGEPVPHVGWLRNMHRPLAVPVLEYKDEGKVQKKSKSTQN